MRDSLSSQLAVFAAIFKTSTSGSKGWGELDTRSGNAPYSSWKACLEDSIEKLDFQILEQGLHHLELSTSLAVEYRKQFEQNIVRIGDPARCLVHGDLGFDNILINERSVAAVIDWEDMGYGDWLFEFARLNFWWPGRYGDALDFAKKYSLDTSNFAYRLKTYTSHIALTTLNFAVQHQSESTQNWLKDFLPVRLG